MFSPLEQRRVEYNTLLPVLLVPLDDCSQVSPFTVLHEDVNKTVFAVNDALQELDNVGVLEILEDVDFRHQLLLFLRAHFAIVDFLPCQDLFGSATRC